MWVNYIFCQQMAKHLYGLIVFTVITIVSD